jgi:hypothetical protein
MLGWLGACPRRLRRGLGLPSQGARLRSQFLGLLRRSLHRGGLGRGFGGRWRLGRQAAEYLTRTAPVDRHHHQVGAIVDRPVPGVAIALNP